MRKLLLLLTMLAIGIVAKALTATVYVKAVNAPYLYAWIDSGELLSSWPGTLMTETETVKDDTFWKMTIMTPDDVSSFNIIFNNNMGGQTADIDRLSFDHFYTYDGYSGYTDITADYVAIPNAVINQVEVRGEYNAWEYDSSFMEKGEGNTYTMLLDFSDYQEDQEFKLVINGDIWIGFGQMTIDAPEGWVESEGQFGNIVLRHSITGYKSYLLTATWDENPDASQGWTLMVEGKEANGAGGDSKIGGDVNGDGVVDVADVGSIISVMAGTAYIDIFESDVNGDGCVDFADGSAVVSVMAGTAAYGGGPYEMPLGNPDGKAVLSVEPFNIENGGTAKLVINMDYENTEVVAGWAFSLYLPEGVELNTTGTSAKALLGCCTVSAETHDEDVADGGLQVLKRADGGYLFVWMDQDNKTPLISTQGQLIKISLRATGDVNGTGKIVGISLASSDDMSLDLGNIADAEFSINNGNGQSVYNEDEDVTELLDNPDFSAGSWAGWTLEGNLTGNVRVLNSCGECWNTASFDVYQEIEGAPVGVYEISVQGFYRYLRGTNAWNAYEAQTASYVQPGGAPCYVYLNNNPTPFMNIYDEKITDNSIFTSSDYNTFTSSVNGNTYYAPDQMWTAADCYATKSQVNVGDNMYTQKAYGLIANQGDQLRIGVKGSSNQGGDSWVIFDNFKLYYRGFKADVVRPVLETAIADLQQYATMLMGKTEYATLNSAFADALTAIDNNDGEAMFRALNTLYDVKEAVIVSKDIFLEQDVVADTLRLAEALRSMDGKKLAQTTLENARELLDGIKGNTLYENDETGQLKSDVTWAIETLWESVALYEQFAEAIGRLADEKASLEEMFSQQTDKPETLIAQANQALTEYTEMYETGSVSDDDVPLKIEEIDELIIYLQEIVENYITPTDWAILKAAWQQMNNGEGWSRNWSFETDITSPVYVPGVTVINGNVTDIDLSDNNLSGAFPYALLDLPALQTLYLSSNKLTGDMGKELQEYASQHPTAGKSLKVLDISFNQLKGNIGLVASLLPSLIELDASSNRFSEVSPMISRTVSVELGDQQLDCEIALNMKDFSAQALAAQLPSIVLYDHYNQTFSPDLRLHISQPSIDNDWHMYIYLNDIQGGGETATTVYELSELTSLNERDDPSPWTFEDYGQTFTISSEKAYQAAPQNTVKYSRNHNFTIGIPDGLTVHAVRFLGFSNTDMIEGSDYECGYVSQFDGNDVPESNRVLFPARNIDGYTASTVPMAEQRLQLSQPRTGGTITFRFGGQQIAAIIYVEASDASETASSETDESKASYTIRGTGAYRGQSGDLLKVDTGGNYDTPWGCTFTMRLSFDEGDGNFDGEVNVLDLQSDVNYIMERIGYDYGPFNYTASNLWKDEIINVQDVICLVNKLMDSEPQNSRNTDFAVRAARVGAGPVPAHASSPNAELYVHDGKLMVNTSQPVAAFDITVGGASSMNVAASLQQMGMTVSTKTVRNDLRIIGYAMNGAYIPVGSSIIGTLDAEIATVSDAMLSDSEAKAISVAYGSTTTGVQSIDHSSLNNEDSVYDLQGRKLSNGQINKGLYIKNGRVIIK